MKVLLFTLEYPPFKGGVANYYDNLVKYWEKPDEIFVLHNNENKLIKKWIFPRWLLAILQLWISVKKNNIKHILVGHVLPLGTATYFVSRFIKIPYSVILHGMDFAFALKNNRKKVITKKILNNAENIICGNSYTAGLVKEFLGDEKGGKVKVVNPGISSRFKNIDLRFKSLLEHKYNLRNKIVLLSVGRLVKRKGFDKVIESLPEVLKKVPNLVYIIVGNGSEILNLKSKILNLNLKDNIIIITDADDKERNSWYNTSDIFIMPSRNIDGDFEGFGIVYLEANLAGKPVIAGDSGGVRDAVVDNLNGLLVDPESKDEIYNAIIKLAEDEELREKLGEQGRERVVREFRLEKQVKKIYDIYNNSNLQSS
ncbi:MAG: glycosyltransferase family 4 protein [Candidatus Falkowbacteria bacterium]